MANNKTSGLKPGEKTPASGQYEEVGPRGGKGPEVTSIKDKPLPPTKRPGSFIQARRSEQKQVRTREVIERIDQRTKNRVGRRPQSDLEESVL